MCCHIARGIAWGAFVYWVCGGFEGGEAGAVVDLVCGSPTLGREWVEEGSKRTKLGGGGVS